MLIINICNTICIIFSPFSKVKKKWKKYCLNIINQMKEIYNLNNISKEIEIDKTNKENIKDIITNNNDNKNKIFDNINNINNKINNNLNIFECDKNNQNNIEIKNNKNLIEKKNRHAKFNNNENIQSNTTRKSQDKINNIKIIRINKRNKTKNILFKSDRTITHLNKNNNMIIEKNDNENIKELIKKDNSDFYIYNIIKYIPLSKRKKYLSESEIEDLSYKNAIQIDDRNKSKYYFSLLKEKNIIISIFLNDKDYNISSVKITLFIFSFILSLTINALFFDDEAIYNINQDEGSFNLNTQISKIIYSAIISKFISFFVEFIALSHDDIIELRNYKDINEAEKNIPKIINKLKIKYYLFYGITIFFNLFFFYYITAFCAIYTIIQTHMITDSLISFLLEISYSIILSLISAIIRVTSLKKENKFRHFLYIISWLMSLI